MTRLNLLERWLLVIDGTVYRIRFCAAVIGMLITLNCLGPIMGYFGISAGAHGVILFSLSVLGLCGISGYMMYCDVEVIQQAEDV